MKKHLLIPLLLSVVCVCAAADLPPVTPQLFLQDNGIVTVVAERSRCCLVCDDLGATAGAGVHDGGNSLFGA